MNAASIDRRTLLGLLTAGTMAVAPHALELPLWVIAVFAVAAGWRYLCEQRGWYRPGRWLRTALLLLVLVAIYRKYGTLLGRDPGVALLITLLGLKFFELKTVRDYFLSLFLFYLVILSSFLYSQSLWLGAWALLAVIVCTAGLIQLVQPAGMDIRQRLRLSGVMLAKALPLMLIVYLLFPRISGTLWGLPADAYSGLTGMPDKVQPGSIRSLSQSSEVAFRVTFETALPPMRELYWRGLVLWETDGRGWNRGQVRASALNSFFPLGKPVHYQVTLEASNKPWMLALDLPASTPKDSRLQPDFTLEAREPIHERKNYTVTSYTRYRTGDLGPVEQKRALQLPRNLSPRVRALAEAWRGTNADAFTVARTALDYFHRENFVYTLNPPLLGSDPVDEFLFDTRRGFCEHYASAFVTLMRAAGIPSRMVIGYMGGELNPAGRYLIVRQSDAHAWAEIWLPERGWVRVDPTGAIAPERIELGFDAARRLELQGVSFGSLPAEALSRMIELGWFEHAMRQARWYWDYTNIAWYRWVVDYGKERQERFLSSLGLDDISWGRLINLIGVIVLLVTLVYALILWRPKKSADPVLVLYLRFCRKLARAGIKRAPHEGALAYAERATRIRPNLKSAIDEITNCYNWARYGRTTSKNEMHQLKYMVAKFKTATNRYQKSHKTRYQFMKR
jgi:transglutaminase-like putative cysteine protease